MNPARSIARRPRRHEGWTGQNTGYKTRSRHELAMPLPALDGSAGLRIAVTDDIGFFEVEPEVTARLEQAVLMLTRAGATVTRPRLAWDRSIADGWIRHWPVYLAAFFGADLDRIGSLADPRLVAAVA